MRRTFCIDMVARRASPRIHLRHLSTHKHLDGLNGQQRRAVEFLPNGSLQILAGPGSGKTRVLTSRVAELVLNHSYSPASICAVTFTRKASKEMKARLQAYLGEEPTEQLKLGTFHSVCAKYLRSYGPLVQVDPDFLVWDQDECTLLIKYIAEYPGNGLANKFPADKLYKLFSQVKEQLKLSPHKTIEGTIEENSDYQSMVESTNSPLGSELGYVTRVYFSYAQVLERSKALDFTDLLSKGLDVLRAAPWTREVGRLRHVLVDEFQDTSGIQYLIVKELFKATEGSISVVGDPDQSIYGWRGADNRVFKQMKQDLPQTE